MQTHPTISNPKKTHPMALVIGDLFVRGTGGSTNPCCFLQFLQIRSLVFKTKETERSQWQWHHSKRFQGYGRIYNFGGCKLMQWHAGSNKKCVPWSKTINVPGPKRLTFFIPWREGTQICLIKNYLTIACDFRQTKGKSPTKPPYVFVPRLHPSLSPLK